jgi:hypothetical protein
MPECKFGINDRLLVKEGGENPTEAEKQQKGIQIDDIKFH